MAWTEAALEELGLAPAWVRRDAARAVDVNEAAAHAAGEAAVAAVGRGAQPASPDAPREPARRIARDGGRDGGQDGASGDAGSASPNDAAHAMARVAGAEASAAAAVADERAALARQAGDGRGQARQAAAESGVRAAADAPAPAAAPESRTRDATIARGASPDEPGVAGVVGVVGVADEPSVAGGARRARTSGGGAEVPASALDLTDAAEATRPAAAPAPAALTGGDAGAAASDEDMSWFDLEPVHEPVLPDVAARPAATTPSVAELGWDELRARVADCERCRLCEKRTNTVFGVGDEHADWMLVGEAPGENEDKQGEPFVGQAGKLLDNMLRALALKRGENVYIANVIKCRPPGNRNPEPDEVARCEPYLQRQVALVKPKLIVALGRFAAQTLLKTDGSIASMRGRVHQYEGVPVIVTYHPAYLLRSLQDKAKAWSDLCLANDTYRSAAPAADPP
ncbi:phage SPO1 DNA polymerase domain-containing protein [Burkholderia pseudomallei]|uniref:uracil-DNA glycosylase n=1 Tax=Burkholderia pseudomallei TaxID=28450 RepID=UPI0005DA9A20|nr:uracil-DNA glycosylase [Burkholderia pseudomallei]CAJ9551362.1 phage SPO1 DNA polymerase domain-containing protein [Burkholderia pseudomallei]CAJ9568955.1 phage SPO1 DNA polymerase domain-containing protein [Burkholderia pseudomallei]CAJ9610465.1 phage SPO1 DNA polymerase domain-containing protein [Burkholderia pseudomallei]CAJ9617969.1 phage SPO1 DNA polymerase domain-containing protein [Burkholderia pseudomallei]CAJ9833047.1 phage SPO1 DNA polymerase domain-containing protein [Burkholderi